MDPKTKSMVSIKQEDIAAKLNKGLVGVEFKVSSWVLEDKGGVNLKLVSLTYLGTADGVTVAPSPKKRALEELFAKGKRGKTQ